MIAHDPYDPPAAILSNASVPKPYDGEIAYRGTACVGKFARRPAQSTVLYDETMICGDGGSWRVAGRAR